MPRPRAQSILQKQLDTSAHEADEGLSFFDCYETMEDLSGNMPSEVSACSRPGKALKGVLPSGSSPSSGSQGVPPPTQTQSLLNLVPEEELEGRGGSKEKSVSAALQEVIKERYPQHVPVVTSVVLERWRVRLDSQQLDQELKAKIKEGFPELNDWTNEETVHRMLRAANGEPMVAAEILMKAIEARVRMRDMFLTMRCKVTSDMRVIGRDCLDRPAIYLCARNQKAPLREMIPQMCLAYEAATQLSKEDGQFVLIADMHRFAPSMNMDPWAFKNLADNFGTVFADRLNSILIVDFSMIAQTAWKLLKPFLSERTQKKINFVSGDRAREVINERFRGPTAERILSALKINRNRDSTDEERELHALRTSICNVPLGALRSTDEAG